MARASRPRCVGRSDRPAGVHEALESIHLTDNHTIDNRGELISSIRNLPCDGVGEIDHCVAAHRPELQRHYTGDSKLLKWPEGTRHAKKLSRVGVDYVHMDNEPLWPEAFAETAIRLQVDRYVLRLTGVGVRGIPPVLNFCRKRLECGIGTFLDHHTV